jgi:hypothetical protein
MGKILPVMGAETGSLQGNLSPHLHLEKYINFRYLDKKQQKMQTGEPGGLPRRTVGFGIKPRVVSAVARHLMG